MMTHRERIEALQNGEQPDRMPVSFWRHFYESESSSENLAGAMLAFQQKYDWDLLKINPRGSYHCEDWGNLYHYSGKINDKPRRLEYAVHNSADWDKIVRLDPDKAPVLADHLRAVRLIRQAVGEELPVVMTVFNPLSIAGDLVCDDQFLIDQMRNEPQPLSRALEVITQTFTDFCKAALRAGADGIFFATTQWASYKQISPNEYREFGRKFDLMLWEEILPLTKINVLHVCCGSNLLEFLADYPLGIVNWDMSDKSNLDAQKGAELLKNRVILGGVDSKGILQHGSARELENLIEHYRAFAENYPFMLGPDCAIPVTTPEENLRLIRTKMER